MQRTARYTVRKTKGKGGKLITLAMLQIESGCFSFSWSLGIRDTFLTGFIMIFGDTIPATE